MKTTNLVHTHDEILAVQTWRNIIASLWKITQDTKKRLKTYGFSFGVV